MTRIGTAVVLAGVLALAGCGGDGGDDGDDGAGSPATSEQTDTPGDEPATDEPATDEPTTDEQSSEDPDLCALFTADDFETVTGEPAGGPPDEGQVIGSLRGSCTYSAEAGFPMVMVSAYNASDREATLELVDAEPVDGLGAEAHWAAETGLLISLDGKDWYLQVLATGDGMDFDQARSVQAAEIVLDRL